MGKESIEIEEVYKNYVPPFNARDTVHDLVSIVPNKYINNLRSIVIRNSDGLSGARKRGKTKWKRHAVEIKECAGLYHQKWGNESAWIEIFIDNLVRGWPKCLLKVSFFRDLAVSQVLYHEMGHHVHKTVAREYSDKENVAEKWRARLSKIYFRKKHWHIVIIFFPVFIVARVINKRVRKSKLTRRCS